MSFFSMVVGGGIVVAIVAITRRIVQSPEAASAPEENTLQPVIPGALVYNGADLDFSDEVLCNVLIKHFPYYNNLDVLHKEKFLSRLKQFMQQKSFVIHDKSGFREMPILLSATAIMLSFGLELYMLPYYRFIHIFPAEFIGVVPTLRVLAGNVSGNNIHISWKHFLQGFRLPDDGQNVGLHEMAHAYYYQYFETGMKADPAFTDKFPSFSTVGDLVLQAEKKKDNTFYSAYGLSNLSEFWAESVELFFERPAQFKEIYPELYATIVTLLNQDPGVAPNEKREK